MRLQFQGQVRDEINQEAISNLLRKGWVQVEDPEPPQPNDAVPDWWWVTKDAIVSRIATYGDDAVVMLDSIIQAQPRAKQIIWREAFVFRSDNQELRALAGALAPFGVDPDVIFAYDPLAPKR